MSGVAVRARVAPAPFAVTCLTRIKLRDLVVDGAFAEVDCQVARTLRWSEQVLVLASRPRAVLEPTTGTTDLPAASGCCSAGSKQPSARLTSDFSKFCCRRRYGQPCRCVGDVRLKTNSMARLR
jgi:hypothetical protein